MLALAAASGACSGRHDVASRRPPASPTSTVPSAAPTPTASATPPALPSIAPWHAGAGELEPAAKVAAARRIEHLVDDANRRVEIIDAQYGGLLATSASVLLVCR